MSEYTEFVVGDEVIPGSHLTPFSVLPSSGASDGASTVVEVEIAGEPTEIAIVSCLPLSTSGGGSLSSDLLIGVSSSVGAGISGGIGKFAQSGLALLGSKR